MPAADLRVLIAPKISAAEGLGVCITRKLFDGLGLCRRTAQLREKFCFTCCCERCAAERSPPPPAQNGAHDDDAPSPPAWFLSAMAPPGLPDEAAPEDVGRSMSQIRNMLSKLMEQAQELFVRGGRAAEAWAVLEAGIFKARHFHVIFNHPLHGCHHCMQLLVLVIWTERRVFNHAQCPASTSGCSASRNMNQACVHDLV